MQIEVAISDWSEFELVDSGYCRKLERFGKRLVIRGEPKAWWKPDLQEAEWRRAVAIHQDGKGWSFRGHVPREWPMHFDNLTIQARFTETSKHLGVFPEQSPHWRWMQAKIKQARGKTEPKVLSLFGYTGVASLVAAAAGCSVTHVDASKPAVAWARTNQQLSNLNLAPIRWILDDAIKYVKREIRRGVRYNAILLDPPSFGRGPNRELWKVEKRLTELLDLCRQALSDHPLFIILTMYNIEASSLAIGNLLNDTMRGYGGAVQVGELALKHKYSERLLPLSIFGRWESA
jgi:23S rRNA (cytosine1962-C5)-methyltransferase